MISPNFVLRHGPVIDCHTKIKGKGWDNLLRNWGKGESCGQWKLGGDAGQANMEDVPYEGPTARQWRNLPHSQVNAPPHA